MKQENVVRNVPLNNELMLVKIKLAFQRQGIWQWKRGRGHRHGKRRYHQSMPLCDSERCSIYITNRGESTFNKTYWDYLGWDWERDKPHLKFAG